MDIKSYTAQGQRPYQEDRFHTHSDKEGTLLAVMDGHGGSDTAQRVKLLLPVIWEATCGSSVAVSASAELTFERLHEQTREMRCGTTLSLAWIPADKKTATVAVLGDSPVIIWQQQGHSPWVAPEHNVRTNLKEADAVSRRGGMVVGGYAYAAPQNINPYSSVMNSPGLQMSRALGDSELDSILERKPEIFTFDLIPGSIVLVASDGLLDPGHGETDDIISWIGDMIFVEGADAKELVKDAVARKTGDNVTAIVARI